MAEISAVSKVPCSPHLKDTVHSPRLLRTAILRNYSITALMFLLKRRQLISLITVAPNSWTDEFW